MKIRPYPKYQQTGVEWLGEIPVHWEVRRLKFLAQVCNGQDQKAVLDDAGKYLIFGSGGPFGLSTRFLYGQTSVLLGRKGTIDKPLFIEEPFWTVDTMFYTRIEDTVFPKYFFYLCKTIPFAYVSDLTTLPSMTQSGLGSVQFAYVEYVEQQQIAAFLDWKTSQIDALIAKKQALLQKLKEKRLAVITQGVTKGLNPDAPMRDSGIAWLGEVPAHWKLPALALRYTVELGKMLDEKKITKECLVPYLRNVDVQWGRINYEDLPEMDIHTGEYARYSIKHNDVLVCEGGEVGRAAIVDVQSSVIGFQKALHRLRATSPNDLPEFIFYTLLWAANTGVFNEEGSSTIAHLTAEKLRRYRFPQPPLGEQLAIVQQLKLNVKKILLMIEKVQSAITHLTEYRAALITAATTGKIDVRHWSPTEEKVA